eukprot:COSAG01_NODE_2441_length_7690_cov_241.628903_4_plen_386_part_00
MARTRRQMAVQAQSLSALEPGAQHQRVRLVSGMLDTLEAAFPRAGAMQEAQTLLQSNSQFASSVINSIAKASNSDDVVNDVSSALVWATQRAAAKLILAVQEGEMPDEQALKALDCVVSFEEKLRNDSAVALRLVFPGHGQATVQHGQRDGDGANVPTADLEQQLGQAAERRFAFAPLLHFIRATLDPGNDPSGEQGEALRARMQVTLSQTASSNGGDGDTMSSVETLLLRKELQVGKYEMDLPFWRGAIDITHTSDLLLAPADGPEPEPGPGPEPEPELEPAPEVEAETEEILARADDDDAELHTLHTHQLHKWVDGQHYDPQRLAAHRVRVKVDGYGEGVVQAFNKATFCAIFWACLPALRVNCVLCWLALRAATLPARCWWH